MLTEMAVIRGENGNANRTIFNISGPNINDGVANRGFFTVKKSIFRRKATSLMLLLLVILLFVLFVTLLIYCIHDDNSQLTLHTTCKSKECLTIASNLLASIESSINPCDNFYDFVCKNWPKDQIDHGWFSDFSNFLRVEEKTSVALLNFLQSDGSNDEPFPVKQTRDLYRSCVDRTVINEQGYATIVANLKTIGLPVVPRLLMSHNKRRENVTFDWMKVDVNVNKMLDMHLFFGVELLANEYNMKENLIFIRPPKQPSSLPNQNLISITTELNFKKYAFYIIGSTLDSISYESDENLLQKAVDKIWRVYRDLAYITKQIHYPYDRQVQTTIEDFEDLTYDHLDEDYVDSTRITDIWTKYLELLFKDVPGVDLDLEGADYVHYYPSELYSIVDTVRFITESRGIDIELYAWYRVVSSLFATQFSHLLTNDEETTSGRARKCADIVQNFMTYAVSYGTVDRSFMNTTKPNIDLIINTIKEAFNNSIRNLSWMDARTKEAALAKNAEMLSFVGHPNWLFNQTAIEDLYKDIIIRSNTYLENMISIVKKFTLTKLEKLRKPNERSWTGNPLIANAFHNYARNTILIPFGILSFPFYNLGLSSLTFGAIGSILAHEISHGFDTRGRRRDKFGNTAEWWSKESSETYDRKSQCFVNQYKKFTIPGTDIPISGEIVLAESIADSGGLNLAFDAYKLYSDKYGSGGSLPGFKSYSQEQLFFMSFAYTHCESLTEHSITEFLTHKRIPSAVRVIGSVQNSESFAKAFNCKIGNKMNPDNEKCNIF